MADISHLSTVLVSSFVGALVSFLGAWLKSALEMRSKIDEELLNKRTELYQDLWDKTKILPKWPRKDDVTYENLISFSTDLRKWYYDGGGLYLSRTAQKAFARVQDAIWNQTHCKDKDEKKDKLIKAKEYDVIRIYCSRLRTEITNDLLSRKATPFLLRK